MEMIELIYDEVKATRADVKALDARMDKLETDFKLLRVRHGILGILASGVVAAICKADDLKLWLQTWSKV